MLLLDPEILYENISKHTRELPKVQFIRIEFNLVTLQESSSIHNKIYYTIPLKKHPMKLMINMKNAKECSY